MSARRYLVLALLSAALLSAATFRLHAQAPPTTCPPLPDQAGLHWETRQQRDFVLCRAMDAENRQVFGLMLTQDRPDIRLDKRHRAEAGAIDGQDMFWYYPDVGGNALVSRRIAVVELGEDRYAQLWIDAPDAQRMQALQDLVRGLALR